MGYEAYARFHEIMAEESGQTVVPVLVESIAPWLLVCMKGFNQVLPLLISAASRSGTAPHGKRAYPKSKFVGFDLCDDAIAHAKEMTETEGLTNIEFKKQDVQLLN
ncbi:MAG: hypothetical protein R3C24_09145 [Cyanobacteriota/Melainabacteria group bacterium]